MYNLQQGLINHIKNTGYFKTVEEYAGQIKTDSIKNTVKHPSALVLNLNGKARRNFKEPMNFDIIIITESDSFDRKSKTNTNLKVSADLINYLDENPGFSYNGFSFVLDQEKLAGELFMQNDRYTIYLIHVSAKYLN